MCKFQELQHVKINTNDVVADGSMEAESVGTITTLSVIKLDSPLELITTTCS